MSDGITDSYRDQRRCECYDDFLESLADYLENKTDENLKELKSATKSVDDVPLGLMTGSTKLVQGLDKMLAQLLAQDKRTWGALLLTVVGSYPNNTFIKLKAMSPFAGQVLISVEYGIGFVHLGGELESFLGNIIANQKNLKTYDADKYLVNIQESALAKAKVTWLGCGYYQIKEPRKARQN